jgi:hypothetical protein
MEHLVKESPMYREFSLIGNQKEMFKNIKKSNEIIIDVSKETKKSLSVCIHHGNNRFAANIFYPGFKLRKRTSYSMFTHQHTTSFHFKILKNQGLDMFKLYLESIVKDFLGEVPNDFKIICYNTNALKELV